MELGLASPQVREWVWPKLTFQFEPFKGYSRFLRYPSPEQGLGYRFMRRGVITVLETRRILGLNKEQTF